MKFRVKSHRLGLLNVGPPGEAFLIQDKWDDWGEFQSQFFLIIYDQEGKRCEPGEVKIGETGLLPNRIIEPGKRSPDIPDEFDSLGERHFSIGQSDNYYDVLNRMSDEIRLGILSGLRDCAFDLSLFERVSGEQVMQRSLLRSVSSTHVRTKRNRLAHGNEHLTPFHFEYSLPDEGDSSPPKMSFQVAPHSEPPSNIHVLIGRNGVGKTRCMTNLALAIVSDPTKEHKVGNVIITEGSFSGLVFVSFSAFDAFVLPEEIHSGIRAKTIGLPKESADHLYSGGQLRSLLSENFCKSLESCRGEPRKRRLLTAIQTLENDPLFAEAGASALLDLSDEEWHSQAESLFARLSSGHSIILLTITRLVELVEESTIVLIDEPEGHLHPPLLSAFVRALSDLLISRNGVAILATHSPVVLQEIPSQCVWLLQRYGRISNVNRPSIESFGENVGTLTREVFGLEVTTTGFHALIQKVVNSGTLTYSEVLTHFQNQLGAEAQGIVRSYIAARDAELSPES